ncbi:MAG TPA: DUF3352 domain-containing protein [Nocardioidaceae bacterium]|nr:DUF3352 domain-containing protein [Nocardioidaceae bacterium]
MSTDPPSSSEPEYLDAQTESARSRRGPRAVVLGVAALAVAGAVGFGGWAALTLMSGGSQPSEAVPANALGYVSLDLDPSASQKIEAIQILKKLPALEKEMDISGQDDLRRWVFDRMQEDGTCEGLDYDEDVAPWIGDRIAVAGVPAGSEGESPTPLVALQVSDQDAASKGISALAECGEAGEDFGFAFSGDYALISDSQEHAEEIAAEVEQGTLAEDADFQTWMDRVGEPGIVTMYAAPGAMTTMMDLQSDLAGELTGGADSRALARAHAEAERMQEQLKDLYKDFSGMAGVVRFADGAVEAQFASDSSFEALGVDYSPEDKVDVTGLPAGTAAVLGMSLPDGWGQSYLDLFGKISGDERSMNQMLEMVEAQTGLAFPEDVERLLGDGVAVALDQSMDVDSASHDPATIPAGVRISGDPQEIQAAVDKVKAAFGPQADVLVTEHGDGVVALGLDADYVKRLATEGGLGDDATFQDVVPDAERVASVFYLDFDAVTQWIDQVAEQGGQRGPDEKMVRENLEPLRAVGVSSWVEDDEVAGMLLRISTD